MWGSNKVFVENRRQPWCCLPSYLREMLHCSVVGLLGYSEISSSCFLSLRLQTALSQWAGLGSGDLNSGLWQELYHWVTSLTHGWKFLTMFSCKRVMHICSIVRRQYILAVDTIYPNQINKFDHKTKNKKTKKKQLQNSDMKLNSRNICMHN